LISVETECHGKVKKSSERNFRHHPEDRDVLSESAELTKSEGKRRSRTRGRNETSSSFAETRMRANVSVERIVTAVWITKSE
jgi:hypothetical protein